MQHTPGDTGLIAMVIIAGLSIFGIVQGVLLGQRTKDAQARTNERLRKIEDSHDEIVELKGEIKGMCNDVHMIKEALLEQTKK